jgi:hypothetical protein
MRIWLSAGAGASILAAMTAPGRANYLGSFWDVNSSRIRLVDPTKMDFFLDSGAYSAWSRKTSIDLDEYIAFIRTHSSIIEHCASLDRIPGIPGESASVRQREEAAEESWSNYVYMLREGVEPIPVFHYGEDFKHLSRILDFGCTYIGVGGLVGIPGKHRRAWLDRLFRTLAERKVHIQTHGFGMTSVSLMFRYPWHSVDSTSWIQVAANGGMYLPAVVAGEFVFDKTPSIISVSLRSPNQAVGGKGSNTLPPFVRKTLDRWLEVCGQTYDGVSTNYYPRAVCNVTFLQRASSTKASGVKAPAQFRIEPLFA